MTEHLPPPDLRVSAFVGAWERLEAAQKLKVDPKNHRVIDPLPELYWATLAEAAIYADLARADVQVGLMAGGYLVDQHRRIQENRDRVGAAIAAADARVVAGRERRAKARRDAERTAGDPISDAADDAEHQDQPPLFSEGCYVRVTRGDWAGRCGQVYKPDLNRQGPPMLYVELDPPGRPDDPNEPVMICVVPDDLELVTTEDTSALGRDGDHHCEYDPNCAGRD